MPESSHAVPMPVPVPSSSSRPPGFAAASAARSAPVFGSEAIENPSLAVSAWMAASAGRRPRDRRVVHERRGAGRWRVRSVIEMSSVAALDVG